MDDRCKPLAIVVVVAAAACYVFAISNADLAVKCRAIVVGSRICNGSSSNMLLAAKSVACDTNIRASHNEQQQLVYLSIISTQLEIRSLPLRIAGYQHVQHVLCVYLSS